MDFWYPAKTQPFFFFFLLRRLGKNDHMAGSADSSPLLRCRISIGLCHLDLRVTECDTEKTVHPLTEQCITGRRVERCRIVATVFP